MTVPINPLAGVIVGAILATMGGFLSHQVNAAIDQRGRQRNAALLFGEILAVVERIVAAAEQFHAQGADFAPVTLRLLRAARREVEVYDRNREHLFSLANADLRARLHGFMVRLSLPLERLFDDFESYAALCTTAAPECAEAVKLRADMEEAFKFLCDSLPQIPELLKALQPVARYDFEAFRRLEAAAAGQP